MLADRQQPVALGQQPAVAGRIVGLEADDDDIGAGIEPGGDRRRPSPAVTSGVSA